MVKAIEGFASYTGLLPEQVWDEADLAAVHMFLGRPTGSAMPLMWAHAEYIKLLRSVSDGAVFDFAPDVAARYLSVNRQHKPLEIWKPNRQPKSVPAGWKLRIQAPAPFRLVWTRNVWQIVEVTPSTATSIDIHFVDLTTSPTQETSTQFTFFWTDKQQWEGKNYEVKALYPGWSRRRCNAY